MWRRTRHLIPWALGSLLFHGVFVMAVWHAEAPVPEGVRGRLAVHILPTLARRTDGDLPMPEPALELGPLPRPFLHPPPTGLDAAALMPGPFPIADAPVQALLAHPVLPDIEMPADALRRADPLPVLRREPPAPLLD